MPPTSPSTATAAPAGCRGRRCRRPPPATRWPSARAVRMPPTPGPARSTTASTRPPGVLAGAPGGTCATSGHGRGTATVAAGARSARTPTAPDRWGRPPSRSGHRRAGTTSRPADDRRPLVAQTSVGAPNGRLSAAGEVLVDLLDRDRALPDRGGHPLGRTVAHVADGEHPGQARLERHRPALQRPPWRRRAVVEQVGAGDDEPPTVPLDSPR